MFINPILLYSTRIPLFFIILTSFECLISINSNIGSKTRCINCLGTTLPRTEAIKVVLECVELGWEINLTKGAVTRDPDVLEI